MSRLPKRRGRGEPIWATVIEHFETLDEARDYIDTNYSPCGRRKSVTDSKEDEMTTPSKGALRTARAIYNHDGCYSGKYGATIKGAEELFNLDFPVQVIEDFVGVWLGLRYRDHWGKAFGFEEEIQEEFIRSAKETWPEKDWDNPAWKHISHASISSTRLYPIKGAPGLVVYRNDDGQWDADIDSDAANDIETVHIALVHAVESHGLWDRKRDAVQCLQDSYSYHCELRDKGQPFQPGVPWERE